MRAPCNVVSVVMLLMCDGSAGLKFVPIHITGSTSTIITGLRDGIRTRGRRQEAGIFLVVTGHQIPQSWKELYTVATGRCPWQSCVRLIYIYPWYSIHHERQSWALRGTYSQFDDDLEVLNLSPPICSTIYRYLDGFRSSGTPWPWAYYESRWISTSFPFPRSVRNVTEYWSSSRLYLIWLSRALRRYFNGD